MGARAAISCCDARRSSSRRMLKLEGFVAWSPVHAEQTETLFYSSTHALLAGKPTQISEARFFRETSIVRRGERCFVVLGVVPTHCRARQTVPLYSLQMALSIAYESMKGAFGWVRRVSIIGYEHPEK